jgi:hypothetical protein
MAKRRFAYFALVSGLVIAAAQACGGGGNDNGGGGQDAGIGDAPHGFDGPSLFNDAPIGDGQGGGLAVTPCGTQTITVTAG